MTGRKVSDRMSVIVAKYRKEENLYKTGAGTDYSSLKDRLDKALDDYVNLLDEQEVPFISFHSSFAFICILVYIFCLQVEEAERAGAKAAATAGEEAAEALLNRSAGLAQPAAATQSGKSPQKRKRSDSSSRNDEDSASVAKKSKADKPDILEYPSLPLLICFYF